MTLHIISLGLGNLRDITINGMNAIMKSKLVFLENYTAIMNCTQKEMENFYQKKIILATRELVEKESDKILNPAKTENIAFLVVGDAFGATTHADLFLRAKEKNIQIKIYHNASIMNAIGETGLELYKLGKTTSVVFDDNNWLPETPYNVINENLKRGLHTLCLLDIKVAEPTPENIRKELDKPEPPRFMTINKAIKILKKLEEKKQNKIISDETIGIGIARIGAEDQIIKTATLKELEQTNFGKEMHSLIIPGKLHEIEEQMINQHK
ncbi:diphthine synthase [Candidatus Woesearchaeota archaeon]|nr:diphthine synthase [Candidatus Woesearchaeota archaeon]